MAEATNNNLVKCHHKYEAQQEDELSLNINDIVRVDDYRDDSWWLGENLTTHLSGLFPSNFVMPISSASVAIPNDAEKVQAEYDYEAQAPDELNLIKGDVVTVLSKDDGWWSGEIDGRVGVFPANFVVPYVPQASDKEIPKRTSFSESFKLAAYGVKKGGIGSLFSGGKSLRSKSKSSRSSQISDVDAPVTSPPASARQSISSFNEESKVSPSANIVNDRQETSPPAPKASLPPPPAATSVHSPPANSLPPVPAIPPVPLPSVPPASLPKVPPVPLPSVPPASLPNVPPVPLPFLPPTSLPSPPPPHTDNNTQDEPPIPQPDEPDTAHTEPSTSAPQEEPEKAALPGFKLAAYGVKKGGIGGLLASGIPQLRRNTGSPASDVKSTYHSALSSPEPPTTPSPFIPQGETVPPPLLFTKSAPTIPTSSMMKDSVVDDSETASIKSVDESCALQRDIEPGNAIVRSPSPEPTKEASPQIPTPQESVKEVSRQHSVKSYLDDAPSLSKLDDVQALDSGFLAEVLAGVDQITKEPVEDNKVEEEREIGCEKPEDDNHENTEEFKAPEQATSELHYEPKVENEKPCPEPTPAVPITRSDETDIKEKSAEEEGTVASETTATVEPTIGGAQDSTIKQEEMPTAEPEPKEPTAEDTVQDSAGDLQTRLTQITPSLPHQSEGPMVSGPKGKRPATRKPRNPETTPALTQSQKLEEEVKKDLAEAAKEKELQQGEETQNKPESSRSSISGSIGRVNKIATPFAGLTSAPKLPTKPVLARFQSHSRESTSDESPKSSSTLDESVQLRPGRLTGARSSFAEQLERSSAAATPPPVVSGSLQERLKNHVKEELEALRKEFDEKLQQERQARLELQEELNALKATLNLKQGSL